MKASEDSEPLSDSVQGGARAKSLWWGREIFLSRDGEDMRCPDVIDVTGRARFLVFGPYASLSPGVWRTVVSLEICPEAARRPMAVQFGAEPDYTTTDIEIGVPGPHSVEVIHAFREADQVQVRLWLKRAAFHGEVRLIGAHVERLGDLAD
jgi:hypothetical protein